METKQKNSVEMLERLIPLYLENKTEMANRKKYVDRYNSEIKQIMTDAGMQTAIVGNTKATCTISERVDFIDEALIAKIKELGIKGIIKKREYVDMNALENAIYNKKIDPIELADCQTKKQVVTLRISTVKTEENDN